MKKFRFRLAAVERVRQIELDQARARVLIANQALAHAEAEVANRIEHRDTLARPTGAMSHAALSVHRFQVEQAIASVRFADEERVTALQAAESAREEWRAAKTRLQALERLHEQARADHAVEVRRDEDRSSDEISTTRFLQRTVDA